MLVRREASNGIVWYESPLLRTAGAPHAFSTRLGGVSRGVFESLNFGNPSGCAEQDPRSNIDENCRRLMVAAGIDPESHEHCRVHQVHADAVVEVLAGGRHDPHAKADALVTADPRRVVSVRVADCVPVLLASADARVVAAVHAGWRGVALGVVARGVEHLRAGAAGAPIIAAIGPSIGFDAFEVGPEVVEEMARSFGGRTVLERLDAVTPGKGDRLHLDLKTLIDAQLAAAGVASIDATDLCTVGTPSEFFSHRRDRGVTGRMTAMIAPRDDAGRGAG